MFPQDLNYCGLKYSLECEPCTVFHNLLVVEQNLNTVKIFQLVRRGVCV